MNTGLLLLVLSLYVVTVNTQNRRTSNRPRPHSLQPPKIRKPPPTPIRGTLRPPPPPPGIGGGRRTVGTIAPPPPPPPRHGDSSGIGQFKPIIPKKPEYDEPEESEIAPENESEYFADEFAEYEAELEKKRIEQERQRQREANGETDPDDNDNDKQEDKPDPDDEPAVDEEPETVGKPEEHGWGWYKKRGGIHYYAYDDLDDQSPTQHQVKMDMLHGRDVGVNSHGKWKGAGKPKTIDPKWVPPLAQVSQVTAGPFVLAPKAKTTITQFKMDWPTEIPQEQYEIIHVKGMHAMKVVMNNGNDFTDHGWVQLLQFNESAAWTWHGGKYEKTQWLLDEDYRMAVAPYRWNKDARTKAILVNPTKFKVTVSFEFTLIWTPTKNEDGVRWAGVRQVYLMEIPHQWTVGPIQDKTSTIDNAAVIHATEVDSPTHEDNEIVDVVFNLPQGLVRQKVVRELNGHTYTICDQKAHYYPAEGWSCKQDAPHCPGGVHCEGATTQWKYPISSCNCDVEAHHMSEETIILLESEISVGCPGLLDDFEMDTSATMFLWNRKEGLNGHLISNGNYDAPPPEYKLEKESIDAQLSKSTWIDASGLGKVHEPKPTTENDGALPSLTAGSVQSPPATCRYATWGDWSSCTKKCGGGRQFRTARSKDPPETGCTDHVVDRACNKQHC
eukprot:TRINITY_DN63000_c0_g2_i1.p1 TRINITY_DN63000_c0_g2~~TRINITY_DN63000_c0_g2_i1.p1  ORF type:complete len:670 (+),score=60.68 TRINITY_DN63000_c0_g2_i1:59-2068(+)